MSNSAKETKETKKNFLRQFRDESSLELKQLTATQFMEIWSHYDTDGNGYIEGSELDSFLTELTSSVNASDVSSSDLIPESIFNEFKQTFLEAYDENNDGKISVEELAEILPTDENFLFLFRRDQIFDSGADFMKIWIEFDQDKSGFIESNELKEFIRKALAKKKVKEEVTEEKIEEYTDTILKIFDRNGDGKLQLSEMMKLLPAKENRLLSEMQKTCKLMTNDDLDKIFTAYDEDGNNFIDTKELDMFCKDILEMMDKEYTADDLRMFKNGLLATCDINKDGSISKSELKLILNSFVTPA